MDKKYRIHPGWLVAFACVLLNATVFVSLISLPGLFTVPVSDDLEFQRSAFALHMTCATLASMVSNLYVGHLYSKHNSGLLVSLGTAIIGICYILKGFSSQIWQFYVTSALCGLFGSLTGLVAVSILLNRWFGSKLRGKVMGIVQAGSGLGTAVLSSLISNVNQDYGWQSGYYLIGMLILAIVPVMAVCLRKSPQELGLTRLGEEDIPAAASGRTDGTTARHAFRTAAFWLTALGFFITSGAGVFYSSNIQGHLMEIGQSMGVAGAWISVCSLLNMVGKIVLGSATDRWGIRKSMTVCLAVLLGGGILLTFSRNLPCLAIPGMVLYCLGNCVPTVGAPLVILEHFGNKEYGTIMGFINLATSAGVALAPALGGLVYDFTGNYLLGWACISACIAVAAAALNLSYRTGEPKQLCRRSARD